MELRNIKEEMGMKMNQLRILFLSGICSAVLLGGCGPNGNVSSDHRDAAETVENDQMDTNETEEAEGTETVNVGEFSMQDINGETYTQDMFADYNLTMINVFATWCSP